MKDLKNGLNSIKRFSSCAAVRCVIPRKSAEPLRLRSRMLWLLGTRVILSSGCGRNMQPLLIYCHFQETRI